MGAERKAELTEGLRGRFPGLSVAEASLDYTTGKVVVDGFSNSIINVGLGGWRFLDDEPRIFRGLDGQPNGVDASKSEDPVADAPWSFSFALKQFDPSYRILADGTIDYEFDAVVNPEIIKTYEPKQAFLLPKPGGLVASPASPYDHAADLINVALTGMRLADRQKIKVGPDYIISWCGEPGYQLRCSHGVLDIVAIAVVIEFSYISPSYYEADDDPSMAQKLHHWSAAGSVTAMERTSQ